MEYKAVPTVNGSRILEIRGFRSESSRGSETILESKTTFAVECDGVRRSCINSLVTRIA